VSGKMQMLCDACGSDRVVRDAWASWDVDAQDWQLENVFDDAFCQTCETETRLVEKSG
jgi:hypothetical protein